MKKVISVILVLALSFTLCSVFIAEGETQHQVIENFKNGLYIGDWVPNTSTEEQVKMLAENGIQYTFLWYFSYDNPQKVQELKWCEQYGVKVILKDVDIEIYAKGLEEITQKTAEEIYEIIKPSIGNPTIIGYNIFDEPGEKVYEVLGEYIAKFNSVAQGMIPFVNLYPDIYGSYIDRVFTTLGQDFVSVDIYPLLGDETSEAYYYNLKEVGDSAREHGGDFWLFIQSMQFEGRRRPDIYDLRFQGYSAISFGATKLMHFCYSNPFGDNSYAAINKGVKTELYPILQQFNAEMQFLAPILAQYEDLGAFYVSGAQATEEPSYITRLYGSYMNKGFRSIQDIQADEYLLVGTFDNKTDTNKKAFSIVNASDCADEKETDVTFSLRYSDGPVTVTMEGKSFEIQPDENGLYQLHLGAGGGAFIEITEREKTDEEKQIDLLYAACYAALEIYLDAALDKTLFEAETFDHLEDVVTRYQDKLEAQTMTLKELTVARDELETAAFGLVTKEEKTNELVAQAQVWFDQITSSLFDDVAYQKVVSYMDFLDTELKKDPININRVRSIVDIALPAFNNMAFKGLSGDMNIDGKVTLSDVILAARYVAELNDFHYTAMRIGDMNGDLNLQLSDVILIAKTVIEV